MVPPQQRVSPARSPGWLRWIAATLALALLPGCGDPPPTEEDIDSQYGETDRYASGSVNGTSVLADMFRLEGHAVSTRSSLDDIDKFDVVVWAPDSFTAPTEEQVDKIDNWLFRSNERTFIYIGRDYDAEIAYWRSVKVGAPADQVEEIDKRLKAAQARHEGMRRFGLRNSDSCKWFTIRDAAMRKVSQLSGPWSKGVDASQTEIELRGRIEPRSRFRFDSRDIDTLLQSGRDSLAFRIQDPSWGYYDSQLIVVANGSFLLNLPLVNHEHRKLAVHLIDSVGKNKKVVFLRPYEDMELTSGGGGGDDDDPRNMFKPFTAWPLGFVLLHLFLLGIIYCFARSPIFGRPREGAAEATSDFGKHIDALGEMLEKTRNSEFARERLTHYRKHVKGE